MDRASKLSKLIILSKKLNAFRRDEIKGRRFKDVVELRYQARIAELDEKIRKIEKKQDIRNFFKTRLGL